MMTGIEHTLIEAMSNLNRGRPLVIGSQERTPCSTKDEEAIDFMYKIVRDSLREERLDPEPRYAVTTIKNNLQLYHIKLHLYKQPESNIELSVVPKLLHGYQANLTFSLDGEKRDLLTQTHHRINPEYRNMVRDFLKLPVEEGTKTRIPIIRP